MLHVIHVSEEDRGLLTIDWLVGLGSDIRGWCHYVLVFNWCQPAEGASSVVGAFDPDHDRDPQLSLLALTTLRCSAAQQTGQS
ncbi:Uncharacterised protein [Mycobacteroides abscessus]|nr:Uncharacterised protein [Mycobacteroides abscessus]